MPARREPTVRGLTVKQPWAWLIAHGWKPFENRNWWTDYRGPLVIVAGKGTDPEGFEVARQLGIELPDELPTGIVCVVDLVLIEPVSDVGADPFATGPYCWRLARPRRLASPVPYRGNVGLLRVPRSLLQDGLAEEDVPRGVASTQTTLAFDRPEPDQV